VTSFLRCTSTAAVRCGIHLIKPCPSPPPPPPPTRYTHTRTCARLCDLRRTIRGDAMRNVSKHVPGDGIQKKSKLTAVACIGRCLIWGTFSLVLVGCQPCTILQRLGRYSTFRFTAIHKPPTPNSILTIRLYVHVCRYGRDTPHVAASGQTIGFARKPKRSYRRMYISKNNRPNLAYPIKNS
jgi:hypothetical protein